MTDCRCSLRRPLCDRVTLRLQDLAQYRRFWRPTIKYLLKSTCFSSIFTSCLFFSLISYVLLQRLTFTNMIIPMILLIGMELASDLSDTIITQMISKPLLPCEIMYNLAVASLLVMLEIVLWHSVIRFFHEYTHDYDDCDNIDE